VSTTESSGAPWKRIVSRWDSRRPGTQARSHPRALDDEQCPHVLGGGPLFQQAQAVPDSQPDQGRLDSRVPAHPVAQSAHEERQRRHASLVDVRLGKDPDAVTLALPL